MSTKSKKEYNDKIAIWNLMSALDRKDYDYYDRLTLEEQNKISPYLLMRWMVSVEGTGDIPSYYVVATHELSNLNLFNISKHKKLCWLILCTISPKIGKQRHFWLGNSVSTKKKNTEIKERLCALLPNMKEEEIDLIIKLKTSREIETWLEENGNRLQKK